MARRWLTSFLTALLLTVLVGPVTAADAPLPKGAIARLGSLRFRHTSAIQALAFSPNGKLLATDTGHTVYLWEAATAKLLHRLSVCDTSDRGGLAFSPDGKRLAAWPFSPFGA